MFERNRTRPFLIRYALYLYFLGLSLGSTSKALEPFVDRSYVAMWYWIQEFNPKDVFPNKKKARITAFVIDGTLIQIGATDTWLWVAIEPIHNRILGVSISRHRDMLVSESFLRSLIKLYGKHIVYSDGGSWYPEACNSLGLKHTLHSPFEKSVIERAMEYVKDRTESFDDYYPCRKKAVDCNLAHVYRWFVLFIFLYNLSKSQSKINIIEFLMRSWKDP
ncbi:MAG: DDE-type integrase/transposase/recombinase [Nitrososphaeraceae archaeon]